MQDDCIELTDVMRMIYIIVVFKMLIQSTDKIHYEISYLCSKRENSNAEII